MSAIEELLEISEVIDITSEELENSRYIINKGMDSFSDNFIVNDNYGEDENITIGGDQ